MAWTLKDLIIASGNSGVAGQSFRNHVLGAATGVKMTDYKQTAGSWDAQTYPSLEDSPFSVTCTLTLTEGSKAVVFRTTDCITITGLDSHIVSQTVNTSGTATALVQTVGRLDLSGAGVSSLSTVPPSPYTGGGTSPVTVHFIANVNSTASGSDFLSWILTLPRPNTGYPFNTYAPSVDGIVSGSYGASVRKRPPDVTDYDFEWYNDSSFFSLYGTGSQVIFTQSVKGQDKTLWLQWRIKPALNGGNTTWNQIVTGCTFNDPR